MAINIDELIDKIKIGKYSHQQLKNIRKNAESKGINEVVSICDVVLAQSTKAQPTERRVSKKIT